MHTNEKNIFDKLVLLQKQGKAVGIPSICSSNPYVIEASLIHALERESPVLIESTCNQVNQYGGYSNMTPGDFVLYIGDIAKRCRFSPEKIILGGDHLGPYPWQNEPADLALEKARTLVRDYVLAGYSKIHLDACMHCADDDSHRLLEKAVSAQRIAELALVAEETFNKLPSPSNPLRYVIGSEVPTPGGFQYKDEVITLTTIQEAEETIEYTKRAFQRLGLNTAWERVIALVVQPGVDFGNEVFFEYDHERAFGLSKFIEKYASIIYEAHSTDYQTPQALKKMVEDHFAILKVGPALTFAFREGVFALAMIEKELALMKSGFEPSNIQSVLEEAMMEQPQHWEKYYTGDMAYQCFVRKYSLSDRSRYFWPMLKVKTALDKLFKNMDNQTMPLSLVSQFLPEQYRRIRSGVLKNTAQTVILDKVEAVLRDYSYACGHP